MEKLRNKINIILANNEKDYLKFTSKLSYVSPKIFNNTLVGIRKSKTYIKA